MTKRQTALLISGTGTNMQALINAAKADDYPAEICLVVSNRPKAKGIKIARQHNIPVEVIDHTRYESRDEFDAALDGALKNVHAELVCNAGFKRLLGKDFVQNWHNRQLNIHPSLLPAFKGLHTHERALAKDVKITGCSVHFVRHDMDSGPIIAQAAVPILPGDTAEGLGQRVLSAEHKLYPKALEWVASGAVRVVGEKVIFQDDFTANETLFAPPLGAR